MSGSLSPLSTKTTFSKPLWWIFLFNQEEALDYSKYSHNTEWTELQRDEGVSGIWQTSPRSLQGTLHSTREPKGVER